MGTHPATGEFYIGSRTANKHPFDMDFPKYKTSSKYIKSRFDEFEWKLVMEFTKKECAYDYEQYLINEHWGNPLMINKSCFYNGKRFSTVGKDLSGENNSFYGKSHSDDTKQKLRDLRLGSKLSDDVKHKIGQSSKGNKRSLGRKPSLETLEKMRIASTGRKHTDASKAKISKAHKGKSVPIEQIEKQRAKLIGRKHSDEFKAKVSQSLFGNQRSKGYHWFNNGEISLTALECPEGFKPGRIKIDKPPRIKEQKQKVYVESFSNPVEHAENVRQANIGMKFYNNGTICVRTKEPPEDFVPGMLPRMKG